MLGRKNYIKSLFASIDHRNLDAFLAFLSDTVIFRFGNAEPVSGKDKVGDVVNTFLSSIKAVHHEVSDIWETNDTLICCGTVTYTRHDSSTLKIPFSNIFRIENKLIGEYLIFVDMSELYKPQIAN